MSFRQLLWPSSESDSLQTFRGGQPRSRVLCPSQVRLFLLSLFTLWLWSVKHRQRNSGRFRSHCETRRPSAVHFTVLETSEPPLCCYSPQTNQSERSRKWCRWRSDSTRTQTPQRCVLWASCFSWGCSSLFLSIMWLTCSALIGSSRSQVCL